MRHRAKKKTERSSVVKVSKRRNQAKLGLPHLQDMAITHSPKPTIESSPATVSFICTMNRMIENGYEDVVQYVAFSGVCKAVYWDETLWDAVGAAVSERPRAKYDSLRYRRTRLMQAATSSRWDRLHWLLKRRCVTKEYINIPDIDNGIDALTFAILRSPSLETVQLLIDSGADVKRSFRNQYSCIGSALKIHRIDIVKLLLQTVMGSKRPRPEDSAYRYIALTCACQHNDVEAIGILLRDSDLRSIIPNCNLLHIAVKHGAKDAVLALLEAGADIDRMSDRETPLHIACEYNLEIVTILLDHGADKNGGMMLNSSPLRKAIENGCTEIVRALLTRGVDVHARQFCNSESKVQSALRLACEQGRIDIVQLLIDAGAELTMEEYKGLSKARSYPNVMRLVAVRGVVQNSFECFEPPTYSIMQQLLKDFYSSILRAQISDFSALLQAEHDLNASNDNELPLKRLLPSIMKSRATVLQKNILMHLVLDAGADINAIYFHDDTALMHACDQDSPLLVKGLLQRGADPAIRNHQGKTAIDRCCSSHVRKLLQDPPPALESTLFAIIASPDYASFNVPDLLRLYSRDATATREDGTTMLMQALIYERLDAVRALMHHQAVRSQVNMTRCDGVTALMLACQDGAHTDIAVMLVEAGADVFARDRQGDTALSRVAAGNNVDLMLLLMSVSIRSRATLTPERWEAYISDAFLYGCKYGSNNSYVIGSLARLTTKRSLGEGLELMSSPQVIAVAQQLLRANESYLDEHVIIYIRAASVFHAVRKMMNVLLPDARDNSVSLRFD